MCPIYICLTISCSGNLLIMTLICPLVTVMSSTVTNVMAQLKHKHKHKLT